jgi:pyruvate dehydrogenase E2 component (dihydrolipoamide acetyltransferase)
MPSPAEPEERPVISNGSQRILASPLARRLAAERGLNLASLSGSGPHGRIIRADVEAAARAPGPAPGKAQLPAPAPAPAPAASLAQLGYPEDSYTLVPLDGMRRTVARRLTESARDIPHFPLTIDVEIDALLTARARINSLLEPRGIKVSVNDLVIKAAALALRQVPEANASFTPEGIALHRHADISMAVAVDGGLITPIIRKAEQKGLAEIALEAKDLAERARNRKLKPEEFQGGTFSISNLGMFGIRQFGSIINPPQGAILSVGAGEARAVVRDGQIIIRTLMTVTLTCDHRVIDGAIGARWLAAFRALVEDPVTMIV